MNTINRGNFDSTGRNVEASIPEEPGVGKLHAGICSELY